MTWCHRNPVTGRRMALPSGARPAYALSSGQAGATRTKPDGSGAPAAADPRPVLIMAGGTGGHIFPGLAVAEALRQQGIAVAWLGAAGGMEERVVPGYDIPFYPLSVGGWRGKGWRTRLLAPFVLLRAVAMAARQLRRIHPCSVLSMGGFAAGPGGLAAWCLRRPMLVHEQNRIPGVTNKFLARRAQRVLVGFADAFAGTHVAAQWVGNPVRADIAALPRPAQRFAGRDRGLRVLVLGGSQGALALNQQLPRALARQADADTLQIHHQCGGKGLDDARDAYAEAGLQARVEAFIEDMAAAYAWADLAVCRAGALTLAELCAAGVASLLVPFPHAVDDHQTRNAEALVAADAARVVAESDFETDALDAQLAPLLDGRERLLRMAETARELAQPQAADTIAAQCLEVVR